MSATGMFNISGMSEKHSCIEKFSLAEYAQFQKMLHREILAEHRQQGKVAMQINGNVNESNPIAENGNESDASSDEDLNVDEYYFLQPLPTRQRRFLLRQAGIRKIDGVEKEECRQIRMSREFCGCNCKGVCDPNVCVCSRSGIQCQVDRMSFPCGCTRDGCRNTNGRIEFNPMRVRLHLMRTLMQLELEKKMESSDCCNGNDKRTNSCAFQDCLGLSGGASATAVAVDDLTSSNKEMFQLNRITCIGRTSDEIQQPNVNLETIIEDYHEDVFESYSSDGSLCNGNHSPEPIASTSQEFLHSSDAMMACSGKSSLTDGSCQSPNYIYSGCQNIGGDAVLDEDKEDDGLSSESSEDWSSDGSGDGMNMGEFSGYNMMIYDGRQSPLENHTVCSADACGHQETCNFGSMSKMSTQIVADNGFVKAVDYKDKYSGATPQKLEPISEILNPSRFNDYTELLELQGWNPTCYLSDHANGNLQKSSFGGPSSNADSQLYQSSYESNYSSNIDTNEAAVHLSYCAKDATQLQHCSNEFLNSPTSSFIETVAAGYLEKFDSSNELVSPQTILDDSPQVGNHAPQYHELKLSDCQSSGINSVLSSMHQKSHGQMNILESVCDGLLPVSSYPLLSYDQAGRSFSTVEAVTLPESINSHSLVLASNTHADLAERTRDLLAVSSSCVSEVKLDDLGEQDFGEIIKDSIVETVLA